MPSGDIHRTTDLTLEILRQKDETVGEDVVKGATPNTITGETGVFIVLKVPQAMRARPSGKVGWKHRKVLGSKESSNEGTAGSTQQCKESGHLG